MTSFCELEFKSESQRPDDSSLTRGFKVNLGMVPISSWQLDSEDNRPMQHLDWKNPPRRSRCSDGESPGARDPQPERGRQ